MRVPVTIENLEVENDLMNQEGWNVPLPLKWHGATVLEPSQCRLRFAASVGTIFRMSPYEAPQLHDERIPEPRRRKWPVAWALFFGALLIFGGWLTFLVVEADRVHADRIEIQHLRRNA